MSAVKHTPGPWQVMNDYDGATIVIANVDGETFSDGSSTFSYDFVCDTFPDDGDGSRSREIAKADAHLIAAAPELLEALKAMRPCVEGYIDRCDFSRGIEARKLLNAVIAKAEGRS